MNYLRYTGTLAASLLVLASCSNEETWVTEDQAPAVEEFVPGNSEVEIRLGASGTPLAVGNANRASITDDLTGIDSLGIFCLARTTQSLSPLPAIVWFDGTNDNGCCIMKNVKSQKEGNLIRWAGDDTFFYPISQVYAYDFYSYYPYAKRESDLTYTQNSVKVSYTIDGTQDLIWGRATSENPTAYSAKYFRNAENAGLLPIITMQHLLTRLVFFVTPGADIDGGASAVEASEMDVVSIQVVNAYTDVDMMVADYNNLNMAAASRLSLRSAARDTCTLRGANDEPLLPLAVGDVVGSMQQMGESLMLYPEASYQVRVVLRNRNSGRVFDTLSTLSLSSGSFLSGTSYKVIVTVHGPKSVGVKASLLPWDSAEEDPEIEL